MVCLALLLASQVQERPIYITHDSPMVASPAFGGYTTAVSGDGRTVLTGGYDGTLQFWKLSPDGKTTFEDALKIKDLDNQGGWTGVAYDISADGKEFSVSLWDGRFEIWQREPLRRIFRLATSRPAYNQFQFHPFKPWLLVADGEKLKRIDLRSGSSIAVASHLPLSPVPNSNLMVGTEGVVDAATGKIVRKWIDKIENDTPISVSPDGKLAVIAGEDPSWSPPTTAASEAAYARTQTLRVWRIKDGRLLRTMPGFWTSGGDSRDLIWLNSRQVAIPGLGYVRDVLTGRVVRKLKPEDESGQRQANEVTLVRRGQTHDHRLTVHFPQLGVQIQGAAWKPSGGLAILHKAESKIRLPGSEFGGDLAITTLSGPEPQRMKVFGFPFGDFGFDATGPFVRQEFSTKGPAGRGVFEVTVRPATHQSSETIRRWLFPTEGAPIIDQVDVPIGPSFGGAVPNGYRGGFPGPMVKLLDRKTALSANIFGPTHEIEYLSLADGRTQWRIPSQGRSLSLTSMSGSRDLVAFEWEDHSVPPTTRYELCLVRRSTGEIVHRIRTSMVYSAKFSNDGSKLAVIGTGLLGFLDLTEPNPTVHRLLGGTNPVSGTTNDANLLWSSDDRHLIVANSLRPLQIYDVASQTLLATLSLFQDGSWLAVRSDGAVDGSPDRISDARLFENGKWIAADRRTPFFFDLISSPRGFRPTK